MQQPQILEANVTGEEIMRVINAIEPVVQGLPIQHIIVGTMTIAVTLMHPDISELELAEAVRGMSSWLCLFLSTTESASAYAEGGEVTQSLMN